MAQAIGPQLEASSSIESVELACTVYYTPKETGFVAGKGFDVRPRSRPGLEGRQFASDFLKAVHTEGHGLLSRPQRGLGYIFFNGSWGYTDLPKGAKEVPLIRMRSCAVSIRNFGSKNRQCYKLDQREIPDEFSSAIWQVVDVGSSVGQQQIDLYWGEDNPHGPGADLFRPAGTEFTGLRLVRFLTSANPHGLRSKINIVYSWTSAKSPGLLDSLLATNDF